MLVPYTNADILLYFSKSKEMKSIGSELDMTEATGDCQEEQVYSEEGNAEAEESQEESDMTEATGNCQDEQVYSEEEHMEAKEMQEESDMTDEMEVCQEQVCSGEEHTEPEEIKGDTKMPEGVEESTALINLEERDNAADNIGSEHIGVEEAIARCDAAVAKHTRSFIEVGFWLSYINEKIPEMRSYKKIEDFAKEKYGFGRAQTYNYMDVWRFYGVLRKDIDGTVKPMICDDYKGYSITQLREMMKLPEEKRKSITVSHSVAKIKQEVKKEKNKSKVSNPSAGIEEVNPSEYIETLNAETWEDLTQIVAALLEKNTAHPGKFCLRITFH